MDFWLDFALMLMSIFLPYIEQLRAIHLMEIYFPVSECKENLCWAYINPRPIVPRWAYGFACTSEG